MKTLKPHMRVLEPSKLTPLQYREGTQRTYGGKWTRICKRILRDQPLCQVCLQEGRTTPSVEVDHIMPLFLGGTDDDENLQGICIPCHQEKSRRERKARRGVHGER